MSKKDEALKLALRSLKELVPDDSDCAPALQGQRKRQEKAITAIKQAQTQTVQESDCVLVPRYLVGAACAAIVGKRDAPKTLEQLRRYTTGDLSTPPAPAPVPLTDGQVEQIYKEQTGSFIDDSPWALMDFVRAIEAAHGITKGGAA
jgi:hypothetical protein